MRVAVVALGLVLIADAHAQSLASPFATISQKIDSTIITVEYFRPSARGRTIFGSLVRWGELWTPGANWATTLEVSRDVRVEGQPLPAGKYSLWFIPRAVPDSWTVVLSRAARRFHVVRPTQADDQLRFLARADSAPPQEMLTFAFPTVTRGGATLAFQWANTQVPLWIDVAMTATTAVAAHPLTAYAGAWDYRSGDDSTQAPIPWEIVVRGTSLWVRTTEEAVEPGLDTEFELLPVGGDSFHPRQYKNGKLIGDELDELMVFRIDGAVAAEFELRGIAEDKVLGRARRHF